MDRSAISFNNLCKVPELFPFYFFHYTVLYVSHRVFHSVRSRPTSSHLASNGLAERAVQIVKQCLKKVRDGTLRSRIATFLCSYCITPQSTTGVPPAELLLGRRLRTRFDLLQPSIQKCVERKQLKQKKSHDAGARSRKFAVHDKVYVRISAKERWLHGEVEAVTGPVLYRVRMGHIRCCRQDQLRPRFGPDLPQLSDKQEEDISFWTFNK